MNALSINVNGKEISIPLRSLPTSFIRWQCSARIKSLKRMLAGEGPGGFGAHLPVMSTQGSYDIFPVSSAAKGIGLLPKMEYLQEKSELFGRLIEEGLAEDWEESLPRRIEALIEFYSDEDKLDAVKLGSLELYGKRTFQNVQQDPRASLLFVDLESRGLSYMVNCIAEIVKADSLYYRFERSAHDMFHKPSGKAPPAGYIFHVSEVYNKTPGASAGDRIV